jgi:hypothetical protein
MIIHQSNPGAQKTKGEEVILGCRGCFSRSEATLMAALWLTGLLNGK